MLHHPTLDKLNALKFTGMSAALTEQLSLDNIDDLVEKIVGEVKNPELATFVAIHARSMVAQKYSAAASEKKHAQLYQGILGQSTTGFHSGK